MTTAEEQILKLVEMENPDNPLAFVKNIVKPLAKTKLDQAILSCQECEIGCASRGRTITKGNPNASIMIIGESLSQEQLSETENFPLEDSAGKHLESMLEYLNVNPNELFYVNSVNCFPNRNGEKRSSTVKERSSCKTFLDYAIQVVEPLLIICLGAVAVNGINEEIGKKKISDIRGTYFSYRGVTVMPTYHPSYFDMLGGKVPDTLIQEYYTQFQDDIERAVLDLNKRFPSIGIVGEQQWQKECL